MNYLDFLLPHEEITIGTSNAKTSCLSGAGIAEAAWTPKNTAIFVPFRLSKSVTIANCVIYDGVTVSSSYHFDVGIYSVGGVKIVSTGSTSQGVASSIHSVPLVATIGPGVFYMAMVADNTTGTYLLHFMAIGAQYRPCGLLQMASAFPLPVTATFAAIGAGQYAPYIGLTTRSVA